MWWRWKRRRRRRKKEEKEEEGGQVVRWDEWDGWEEMGVKVVGVSPAKGGGGSGRCQWSGKRARKRKGKERKGIVCIIALGPIAHDLRDLRSWKVEEDRDEKQLLLHLSGVRVAFVTLKWDAMR